MEMRPFGNTGMEVSALALGTVELGLDYGFRGGPHYSRPGRTDALRLVSHAVGCGINLLDTARAYGESESIIGEALASMGEPPYIASKVAIAEDSGAITESIDRSLRELRLERLDLLQVHNAATGTTRNEAAWRVLEDAVRAGKVRFLGVSIYGEEAALEAMEHPEVRTLQIPFNLLDQKMAEKVLPRASRQGIGVLVRSAFLRGVLTEQLTNLPPELDRLAVAACRALDIAGEPGERIAELALRFCLSAPGVSSVIVGVRSAAELDANVAAAAKGPLDAPVIARLRDCDLSGDPLVSPVNWAGLI
jgi:aryl-alcohol dehydrogenase-like predicted oxidoreductase